ncbi:MAG: M23 family metallopeptidase [Nocardioidaceae bacterium]
MKHRREREKASPKAVAAIVSVAATATAGAAAADVVRDQPPSPLATASPPAATPSEAKMVRAQHSHAARRAQVQQTSRSFIRTSIARADRQASRSAERDAAARQQRLDQLNEAARQRSTEIERERARQRRLEARRERAREQAREQNAQPAPDSSTSPSPQWVVPVSNYTITATYGEGGSYWSSAHTGLDLATSEGSPVGSAAAGEVTYTGYDGSYGNKIEVTHFDGTVTWYCHLSSIYVGTGDSVGTGTTIGAVGTTGNSTGPHLHLEVHPGGGGSVDPYAFLQQKGAL